MGKFDAVQIKFDKDYLNKLTEDADSGVSKQDCKYHIALHPAQFADFGQSIKDELGRKIAKYDYIFEGIMLGYDQIKVNSNLGVFGVDNCYVHVDIQGDFFVFRPETGMILKGIVTRTTKDHVGCLVYSTFNISLPKPENSDDNWLGTRASMQSEVLFKIVFVDLTSRLPYIRGELLSILHDSSSTDCLNLKNNKKQNKRIKFEADYEPEDSISPQPKGKSKKMPSEVDESMENREDFVEKEVIKKRKRNSLESSQEDGTQSGSKKKHKKSYRRDSESLEESSEHLKVENEDFWEEVTNNISSIEMVNSTSRKSKKKHKKSLRKDTESLDDSLGKLKVQNEDFWEDVSNNITSSFKSDKVVDDTPEKAKKKHKKSSKKDDESLEISSENLKEENVHFWDEVSKNITSSVKLDKVVDDTPEKTKKKHKKSSKKDYESLEISPENLKEENVHFWDEVSKNITSSIQSDTGVKDTPEKTKKKHKKSKKDGESLEMSSENLKVENVNFWEEVSKNITSSIKSGYKEKVMGDTPEKPKKKQKKSRQEDSKLLEEPMENLKVENESFWESVSDNIKGSFKETKKNKKGPKKDKEFGENTEISLQSILEEERNRVNKKHKKHKKPKPDDQAMLKKREERKEKKKKEREEGNLSLGINSLFNSSFASIDPNNLQSTQDSTPKSKKKHKQNLDITDKAIENVEIKNEKLWDDAIEDSRTPVYHNDETLRKKEKRKEKKRKEEDRDTSLNINSLYDSGFASSDKSQVEQPKSRKSPQKNDIDWDWVLELKTEIKKEKNWEEEITVDSKKHKKKAIQKPDFDEEIMKKQERRKEKKKKQEQNDSLESLDIKALFDGRSMDLNSSRHQAMANDKDKGKKRRKSHSVSEEVYLESIKLEVDSEMARISSGKKRKRSKSFST